tara:strand:+ start:1951 stop:2262 length:312 start_codon:yes stop_codon:yes gene_type:complete
MTNKLEGKVAVLEDWVAQFEAGNDDKNVLDNINFLIAQLKALGDRLKATEDSHRQLEAAMQQNNKVVMDFIDEQDIQQPWEVYLKELAEDMNASEEGQEAEDN